MLCLAELPTVTAIIPTGNLGLSRPAASLNTCDWQMSINLICSLLHWQGKGRFLRMSMSIKLKNRMSQKWG